MNIYQIANQMKINHQTIYDINIRVAYYVRVSTLREQQDSSVDNQIIHFEKLFSTFFIILFSRKNFKFFIQLLLQNPK